MLSSSDIAELEAYLPHATDEEKRQINQHLLSIRKVEKNFPWAAYRYDPIGYAYNVLGLSMLTEDQKTALRAAVTPPYMVKIDSGNSCGKTLICAVLVNWQYDSYNPGCVYTTAPSSSHVKRVLWAQIRDLRANAKINLPQDFIGPAAPEMRSDPNHFAIGLTADKGEAIANSEIIYTPSGKKKFGDIAIGDMVFACDGSQTKVTHVFKHYGRKIYKVTLVDGRCVRTDGDHLWSVINHNYGKYKTFRLMSTKEMLETGVTYGATNRPKYYLPTCGALSYKHKETTIPAYTMGVWLGDGSSSDSSITSGDAQMIELLKNDNPNCGMTVRTPKNRNASLIRILGMRSKLKSIGMLTSKCRTKRVPTEYMDNSTDVRLGVIQGLMDTDGYISPNGTTSFTSTSPGLIEDMMWLVRSLGGRASLNNLVDIKNERSHPCYTMNFILPGFSCFRLDRKKRREVNRDRRRAAIKSIEECGVEDTTCIRIEHESSLFVIGDGIVTHNSLKGSHLAHMGFIFDEDEGLGQMYWDSVRTMFKPTPGMFWLTVGNPSTVSSPAYLESIRTTDDGKPMWRNLRMSVLDHPNIIAASKGLPPPIPKAVTAEQVDVWVKRLCTPLEDDEEHRVTDFQWRGKWHRPSGEGETVILGRRPSTGASGVWSDALWDACCRLELPFPIDEMPELGCDVARVLGGDNCDIHAQWGGNSIAHDSANGRSIPATIARLKEMAEEVCEFANAKRIEIIKNSNLEPEEIARAMMHKPWIPKQIPIKIDDCGIGNVISDFKDGWNFIPVNPGWAAKMDLRYPNVRSELWFETMEKAVLGGLSLLYLPEDERQMLRIQAFAPTWKQNERRMRVVESKEDTKKRLGRSPDCFVAGTKIKTINGNKPIEEIMLGELVYTRNGWHPVIGHGQTEETSETVIASFSNGETLEASPNHPVFVDNKGWVRIDALALSDNIVECHNHKLLSCSTGSLSSGSLKAKANLLESIFTRLLTTEDSVELALFIRLFGGITTAKYHQNTIFTTLMETLSTTIFPTLSASQRKIMLKDTEAHAQKGRKRTSTGYAILPKNGTQAMREENGILSTLGNLMSPEFLSSKHATSAAKNTKTFLAGKQTGFAHLNALKNGITDIKQCLLNLLALSAESKLKSSLGAARSAALNHVVRVEGGGSKKKVFNLTVDSEHEYFANGILVHNCMDAFNLAHFHANFGSPKLISIETGVSRASKTMGARIGIGGIGQRGSQPAADRGEEPPRREEKRSLWGKNRR
jgi:hypothetical protein